MNEYIFGILDDYINKYSKGAIIFAIIICFIYWMIASFYFDQKKKNIGILFFLAIYFYFVFSITILSRAGAYISEVNLLPLVAFQKSEWERMYFFVNILLFFPLPIFLYLLFPIFRKFHYSLSAGFFTSIAIEVTQYMFHCGWCDIDDVLSNTFGMVLGWLFIHGIDCLFLTGSSPKPPRYP